MAKRKRKTRRKAVAALAVSEAPTPEQLTNGNHCRDFVTHAETATKVMTYRNQGLIARWHKSGKITDLQLSVIERMEELWFKVYGLQKLTGSYSEPLSAGFDGQGADERLLALRNDLRRIEGHFAGVQPWYSVFEKVCRFGMTGPEACETSQVTARASRDRVLVIVQFVADFIAAKEGM